MVNEILSLMSHAPPSSSSPYYVHNLQAIGQHPSHPGFGQVIGARGHPIAGPYGHYPGLNSVGASNLQGPMPLTKQATTPTLFGKG